MIKVQRREKYSITKYRYGITKYMSRARDTPPDQRKVIKCPFYYVSQHSSFTAHKACIHHETLTEFQYSHTIHTHSAVSRCSDISLAHRLTLLPAVLNKATPFSLHCYLSMHNYTCDDLCLPIKIQVPVYLRQSNKYPHIHSAVATAPNSHYRTADKLWSYVLVLTEANVSSPRANLCSTESGAWKLGWVHITVGRILTVRNCRQEGHW
jgi:hypothetical protein